MTGAELIAAERQRQIDVEGYHPRHDSAHADESLALAACSYAIPWTWRRFRQQRVSRATGDEWVKVPTTWPWATWYWKPSPDDRVRELVKAGALIAAEIDRLTPAASDEPARCLHGQSGAHEVIVTGFPVPPHFHCSGPSGGKR